MAGRQRRVGVVNCNCNLPPKNPHTSFKTSPKTSHLPKISPLSPKQAQFGGKPSLLIISHPILFPEISFRKDCLVFARIR